MISLPKQPIKTYMSSPLKTLNGSDTLHDALFFSIRIISMVPPSIDNGKLAGIITMSDIARAVENNLSLTTKVSAWMTADVVEFSRIPNSFR